MALLDGRVIAGCLGNGITYGDVITNKTLAHVAPSGEITWYVNKSKLGVETVNSVEKISQECQAKSMISADSIIKVESRFITSYYSKTEQTLKHIADIFHRSGSVMLKVWQGIIPVEILDEMTQKAKATEEKFN